MCGLLTPIVLFVYNRPWHTKQTIEALLRNEDAKNSPLYIYADGPKDDATEENKRKVAEVRRYIHSVSGFSSIKITEQPINKGLDPSEIDAITEIIKQYGKVIVLEDDVIVHRYFIRFMNEALEYYKDNKKVNSIGSYNPNIPFINQIKQDVYASYRTATYGWATWQDRWSLCKWEKSYLLDKKRLCNRFKYNRGGGDLYDNLLHYLNGFNDAWDARWQYSLYENDSVCIRPTKSLSYNIGFDGTGEHCGIVKDVETIKPILYSSDEYLIVFTKNIRVSYRLQYFMCHYFKYDNTPLHKKIKWKIKGIIRNIFKQRNEC